jgi:hypothetical protein
MNQSASRDKTIRLRNDKGGTSSRTITRLPGRAVKDDFRPGQGGQREQTHAERKDAFPTHFSVHHLVSNSNTLCQSAILAQ